MVLAIPMCPVKGMSRLSDITVSFKDSGIISINLPPADLYSDNTKDQMKCVVCFYKTT